MPQVGKKKYPYTEAGMKAAKMAAKKKPASAADFRKADQASIAKGPLSPREMKDYAATLNGIAEKGMKVGGSAEGKYVRMYNKYNKPESKLTGAMYSSLKKDYAALAGVPRKKITPEQHLNNARTRVNNAKKMK
jgi:hypothetical protein